MIPFLVKYQFPMNWAHQGSLYSHHEKHVSFYPPSHVTSIMIRELPDNFGVSAYFRPFSDGTRDGMLIRRNSGGSLSLYIQIC